MRIQREGITLYYIPFIKVSIPTRSLLVTGTIECNSVQEYNIYLSLHTVLTTVITFGGIEFFWQYQTIFVFYSKQKNVS